jgi:hypothetical protein
MQPEMICRWFLARPKRLCKFNCGEFVLLIAIIPSKFVAMLVLVYKFIY